MTGLMLLAGAPLLLMAAVVVSGADLEVHPNVSGGNPNDSYLLKLIGDGDTGADVAMTLGTIPTTDSDYRLAISQNGGTERFSFTDAGNLGIGDTTPNYVLDVDGDARLGWHGSSTRIKIIPRDFMGNDDGSTNDDPNYARYEDDDAGKAARPGTSAIELYTFVDIPMGYTATHVRIYGGSTDTVTVYESDIDDGEWGASLGSANTGTEIDITDVDSDATNFLVIQIATNSTGDDLYGGYVTIERQ